jgi:predicted metal-dependent hydrolase
MIDYQVLRSRRKTLALQVKQGLVFVRAPYHIDEKCISSFIQKKDAWLRAKIFEQNQTVDYCCDFTQDSKLFVFGQLVTLNITFANSGEKSSTSLIELTNGHQALAIVLSTRIQHKLTNESQLAIVIKKQIEHYFMQQAQRYILPKVEYYSKLTQLAPTSIKIRQYRARWGSCNNRGELSFNYLLMMLPNHVIDYVVVHELCHLRYLNHSTTFWQLVAKFFPDYIDAKKWIKVNQSALHWRSQLLNN